MNKTTIKNMLRSVTPKGCEVITRGQVKAAMQMGNSSVDKLLAPLDYFTQGKTHKYIVDEVADRILAFRQDGRAKYRVGN